LLLDAHTAAERAETVEAEGRASQADKLVQIAEAASLFHDPAGDCYARVPIAGHLETWPLRATGFRRWLAGEFWQRYEKVPSNEAVANARAVLEAHAQFRGPCLPVYLRLAPDGQGGIYLDLGNPEWQAVHITAGAWEVIAQPAVCFRRSNGMLALPRPMFGGTLEDLRPYVHVTDDDAWALYKAWLVGAFRPTGPYAGLALYGQQGSAKTTAAKVSRALLDPAAPALRSDPRELRDLAIAARNSWVVAFDNVSHLQPWLSDALCRLSTGGGWATRELYTDLDEVLFDAPRPWLLTGITEYITRGDLLDRAVPLTLQPIPARQRRDEKHLWAAFERDHARLLGALLNRVAAALATEHRVRLRTLPRMADFALWAVAAERGSGEPATFLEAYTCLRAESHQQALDGSPVGMALLGWLPGALTLEEDGVWRGTATELLTALSGQVTEQVKRGKVWPRSARGLRAELTRLAPALRGVGYPITFEKPQGHDKERLLSIEAVSPDEPDGDTDDSPPDEPAAEPSAPSADSDSWRTDGAKCADGCPLTDRPQPPASSAGPSAHDPEAAQHADGCPGARTVADDCSFETVRNEPGASTEQTPRADDADGCAPVSTGGVGATTEYGVLTTPAEVAAAVPALLAAPVLGLDTETTGLDPLRDRLRLVQLATPTHTYLVDCFAVDPRALAPVFAQAGRWVGHNLKFDFRFLMAAGLAAPEGGRLFDTMLAAQLLGAGTPDGYLNRCGLAAVVERALGERLDKGAQTSGWGGPLTAEQYAYAARDGSILLPLADRLAADLAAAGLTTTAEIEMQALPAVAWLEQTGAPFAAAAWADLSDAATAEQVRLEHELTALTGTKDMFGAGTVNWASPARVKALLAARGHVVEDTNEATLLALADREPLARLLLAYREAARKASVYGIEFLKYVHPATGRIHADWLQLGSKAGRMSCQRPNLQQVPRERTYRACFRAPAGRVLVKADYSQIELRIAAELTGDPRMLAAYQQGEDLHTVTAASVLGRQNGAVGPEDRQAAKALNFGLLYGMGAATLREHAARDYGLALTEAEAQHFRAVFFETYAGLRQWHRSQPEAAFDTRTLAGRRRLGVARFTEKLNSPVQGTGADGLKCALGLLWARRAECPSAAPVLCVHDEIVVECDGGDADAARAWLVTAMRDGMQRWLPRVPVVVEAQVGADWSMQV
jgi:DNA polymerase I-like protein with 3'-5' exonuclease and polymerase domains